ncbi:hypothetical protein AAG906_022300 [Vitis piasezkii]
MMMMIGVASVQGLIDLVVAGISLMICLGIFAFIASILCSAAFFHHAKELAPLIPTPSRPPPKCHSCHHCTMTVANTKTDEVASPISLPRLFVSFSTTTTTTVAAPQLIVHVLCLCIVIWKRKGKLLEEVELLMLRNCLTWAILWCSGKGFRLSTVNEKLLVLRAANSSKNSKNKDRIQLTTPRSPFQVTSYALLCQ